MMGGLVMMNFVDRNRCVDHFGLNGFLVKDWLDSLVDVVMLMLTTDCRRNTPTGRGLIDAPLIPELSLFGL